MAGGVKTDGQLQNDANAVQALDKGIRDLKELAGSFGSPPNPDDDPDAPHKGTPQKKRLDKKLKQIRLAESNEVAVGTNEQGYVYNTTITGRVTGSEANYLGRQWVGKNFRVSRADGRTLLSEDGLRQFRPASPKPNSPYTKTGVQANFQSRLVTKGRFTRNIHLDVLKK